MIDLSRHSCLQGALEEAFDAFAEDPAGYSRAWMRAASVSKSLTPCSS